MIYTMHWFVFFPKSNLKFVQEVHQSFNIESYGVIVIFHVLEHCENNAY